MHATVKKKKGVTLYNENSCPRIRRKHTIYGKYPCKGINTIRAETGRIA
ncbi:hypothetical protein HMPREF0080_00334 [Anaeroglobus geminatus F0357]|uniref:Uncharacterized protein n=1 Tax=Anaeroglobus geminatus F0357 TaxID=861450 RepID=G9YFC3_9FIRM|nr:hypothetical protein HMPREF0080_00334 [Anaeroglobus geminatus F0357]